MTERRWTGSPEFPIDNDAPTSVYKGTPAAPVAVLAGPRQKVEPSQGWSIRLGIDDTWEGHAPYWFFDVLKGESVEGSGSADDLPTALSMASGLYGGIVKPPFTVTVSHGGAPGTCNCLGGACTIHPKEGYIIETTSAPAPLPPPQEPPLEKYFSNRFDENWTPELEAKLLKAIADTKDRPETIEDKVRAILGDRSSPRIIPPRRPSRRDTDRGAQAVSQSSAESEMGTPS